MNSKRAKACLMMVRYIDAAEQAARKRLHIAESAQRGLTTAAHESYFTPDGEIAYAVRIGDGSYLRDTVLDTVVLLDECRAELAEVKEKCARLKAAAKRRIGQIPDKRLRRLLMLRYVQGRSWPYVIHAMGATDRWVYKLHAAALQAFAGVPGDDAEFRI